MPDRASLTARHAELEAYLSVARGRVAATEDLLADERAGLAQIEGRLMELTDIIASMKAEESDETL